jgi:hypothetical protein
MLNTNKFILGILTVLLAISFASAVQFNVGNVSSSIEQGSSKSFSFLINNSGQDNVSSSLIVRGNTTGLTISGLPSALNISNGSTSTVSFSISAASNTAFDFIRNFNLEYNGSSLPVYINVTQSNENKIIAELCGNDYTSSNISIGDVDDGNNFDDDWRIADNIELTISDIKNNADDDYKFDVSVYFYKGAVDSSSDVAVDTDELELDNLKINEGKREDAVFNFKVDGKADGNYDLWVKVDNKETGCYAKKIKSSVSIDQESGEYPIITDVTRLSSESLSCGDSVDLEVEVTNIGDKDSDLAKVVLVNKELGLNMYKEINGLDYGDSEVVLFSFIVPANAVQKVHLLDLYTEFDYDDNKDVYDETSDSDYDYTYKLNLVGSNCIDPTRPTLTAKLDNDAIAGKPMNITVSIKNNGASSMAVMLSAQDYDSWSKLESINPSTLLIAKGETKNIVLTLVPTKDGAQAFKVNLLYDGKTLSQDIAVSVSSKKGFLSSVFTQANSTTYLIVGIIILVVLIAIVLVVKLILSRRA